MANEDGRSKAAAQWQSMCEGGSEHSANIQSEYSESVDSSRNPGSIAAGFVSDAGSEDPEHPFSAPLGPHTQRMLARIIDETVA